MEPLKKSYIIQFTKNTIWCTLLEPGIPNATVSVFFDHPCISGPWCSFGLDDEQVLDQVLFGACYSLVPSHGTVFQGLGKFHHHFDWDSGILFCLSLFWRICHALFWIAPMAEWHCLTAPKDAERNDWRQKRHLPSLTHSPSEGCSLKFMHYTILLLWFRNLRIR